MPSSEMRVNIGPHRVLDLCSPGSQHAELEQSTEAYRSILWSSPSHALAFWGNGCNGLLVA